MVMYYVSYNYTTYNKKNIPRNVNPQNWLSSVKKYYVSETIQL